MINNSETNDQHPYTDLKKHWNDSAEKEMAQREEWAHPAMQQIKQLVESMKKDGWKNISWITKASQTACLGWSPDNHLPFIFYVSGEWPNIKFTAHVDGDCWPCRYPVMYKVLDKSEKEN